MYRLCTYIHIYIYTNLIFGVGGGPVGQPPLDPNEKALYQPKPHPFQWQTERICSKETPDWKALEAAKAVTSWALT